MKKIIAADHIEKVYGHGGERRKVLNGVSVSINEGEFVSVMGPSGSGKSTLLFAVSGMDTVDSGKVFFDGRELSALQENELADLRRRRMGFVFQQPTLLKNMNLLDNIILPAMRDHRKNVKKITERARALMKKTGIEGLEKRDITQVSGGQLQRAGICRALLGSPQILFGDEPTGALNQEAAEGIMSLLAEINEAGTAVMLVTHDARIAAKTERILFMCDGQIVSEMQLPRFRGTELEARMERVVLRMRELGI
ncbi:ABC transporter ATP-binding protein [Paenibacillus typhae]|uniref:Putative ABC transport system ATP-binding protein n=1 Tax=Paenibacillus typhae TaxID=1174501 RepID=A0A1G8JAC0_9BACL|nr:ABC transporter ATP-binding protein [Paenibacillus typhae]SDI28218.1 putative ABC transport system ATP-binding protein [Paenibacillus typhae]